MAERYQGGLLKAAKQLPLSEQVGHKDWEVRSQAYDGMVAACESAYGSNGAAFLEFGPLLAKTVGDDSARAVGKALDALQAYLLLTTSDQAARIAQPICEVIASGAGTLRHHISTVVHKVGIVCALFVELDQPDAVL
ncbi:hypothetical protein WJX73_000769 [Symbiochloris irregularis]|uniref:XMAP215/Dis1/CLASP TOG domain-containing protein n=1 Tax=Symbiochloris irregularis TaxID=706552 RepID=A0AAW1PS70_9CHLO